MSLTALSRNLSDHNPILFLAEIQIDWGLKTFNSLDCWWENDSFAEFINTTWGELPDMSIVAKFHCLRSKIKFWNHKVFRDLHSHSSAVSTEMDAFKILSE